jgi:hypothetical protein
LEVPSICTNLGSEEVEATLRKGKAVCLANSNLRAASGDISITENFLLSTLSEEVIIAVPIEGPVSMIPDKDPATPRLWGTLLGRLPASISNSFRLAFAFLRLFERESQNLCRIKTVATKMAIETEMSAAAMAGFPGGSEGATSLLVDARAARGYKLVRNGSSIHSYLELILGCRQLGALLCREVAFQWL